MGGRMRDYGLGVLAVAAISAASPAVAQSCQNDVASFPSWLRDLRAEAAAEGISNRALAALDGVRFDQAVVNRDRSQGVFAQTFLTFSDRMVSSNRLQTGARLMEQHATILRRVEQQFGVPAAVIVALWGLETDFGAVTGDFEVLPALATLAFDCRRPALFRPQLISLLRLIDRGDLTLGEMIGGWAGELGQTQFLPTDYVEAGIDFDGDGRVHLIRSVPDVLASSGSLLARHGWRTGEPWLEEVRVPENMNWVEADVSVPHTVSQWAGWGIVRRDGSALAPGNLSATLMLPMGRNGPAFLGYANFQVMREWNASLVYMTTAAYFATRLAGTPALDRGSPVAVLSVDQVRELQSILIARGYPLTRADGIVGVQTRAAVRDLQVRLGLPADGYPTTDLLARLQGGLTNEEARELQTLLASQGFDIGAIDGVIGPRTRAAITDMQRRLGLAADGVATPEFLARLRAL